MVLHYADEVIAERNRTAAMWRERDELRAGCVDSAHEPEVGMAHQDRGGRVTGPTFDAKSEIEGCDNMYIRFAHQRGGGEIIEVEMVDENRGEVVGKIRVNRGMFANALEVVRYV